jgi:predicted methyltransferase
LLARTTRFAFASALLLALAAPASAAESAADRIRSAVASPARSPENRARDVHRHPVETLTFFGLEPTMHVLELWPGRGWYTEIIGPVVRDAGKLSVTNADPNGPQDKPMHKMAREYAAWIAAERERIGPVDVIQVAPPESIRLGDDASYDLAVTFRNNHTWINGGYQDAVYREVFRVLKPGGVLGVVQHRANAGADAATSAKTGYVPEDEVIDAAKRAGFELVARSEINANPKDTKDHPEGVWTLPPVYRLGDVDRAKYEAIGESDRMTLKFVKPKTAR